MKYLGHLANDLGRRANGRGRLEKYRGRPADDVGRLAEYQGVTNFFGIVKIAELAS